MKTLRIIFGILVSILLLGFIFYKIDIHKVWEALTGINAVYLIPAIIAYFTGIWTRTMRWGFLMRPIKKCETSRLFPVYVISYMVNNVIPLRMGDVYRAVVAGRRESVSRSATLVTIGVERIFDGLTMLVLLALSFWFYPVSDPRVKSAIQIGSIVFLGAIILCYIVVMNKKYAEWIANLVINSLPGKFHSRLRTLFDNFFVGLDVLKGPREMVSIITLSFVTWLLESLSYLIVMWSFHLWVGFHVAISTMALVNLMIIVPAGPGYFGPFELACIIMLGKSGYGGITRFTTEMATAYALILHILVQWIPSTLAGIFYMWKEHVGFQEVRENVD